MKKANKKYNYLTKILLSLINRFKISLIRILKLSKNFKRSSKLYFVKKRSYKFHLPLWKKKCRKWKWIESN